MDFSKMDSNNLARVLASSVNSIPANKTEMFGKKNYLFRIISFDLSLAGAYGVDEGQSVIIGQDVDNYNANLEETIASLENKINSIGGTKNIEFINIDDLTKSVLIFTRSYIDKLLNKEAYIGDMILNYYNIWHLNKTGVRGSVGAEQHQFKYNTFSRLESERLEEAYIPIVVASKGLPIIHNYVRDTLEVSQIAPYLKKESAYAPSGKRVEGSVCYWLPKVVASEYIQEKEPHKILSRTVLEKVLRDGGLFDTPPVKDFRPLNLEYLNTEEVKAEVTEMAKEKLGISSDFRVRDTGSTVRVGAEINQAQIRRLPKLSK